MELLTIIKGFVEEQEVLSIDDGPKKAREKESTKISIPEFVEPIDRPSERTRVPTMLNRFLGYHEELRDEEGYIDLEAFARLLKEKRA